MKSFKELDDILNEIGVTLPELKEAFYEYGEIADKKKFDPKNPVIQVKGLGQYKMDNLQKNVIGKLEDLVEKAKLNNFEFVKEAMNPKGILTHLIGAILDVEAELRSPTMKRKVTLQKKSQVEAVLRRNIMNEVAPPDADVEAWVKKNKARFTKEYGPEKGAEVLYATAWRRYNKKHGK